MIDIILWWTGLWAWVLIAYFFLGRHVAAGLREWWEASWWMIAADFNDPEQTNIEITKHFSKWDLLWIVPQLFWTRVPKGFKRSMDWG